MQLSFSIEGEKQFSRVLKGLQAKKLKPVFEKIGDELVKFYKGQVFDSEGSAIGEAWQDGPAYHRLQVTGKMRGNFKHKATDNSLTVYNPTSYFKFHQSNKPRKHLPRRVMLKLDEPRRQMIVKMIQAAYIKELQKRT